MQPVIDKQEPHGKNFGAVGYVLPKK